MSLGGDQQLGANQLGSRCPPNFYPTSTQEAWRLLPPHRATLNSSWTLFLWHLQLTPSQLCPRSHGRSPIFLEAFVLFPSPLFPIFHKTSKRPEQLPAPIPPCPKQCSVASAVLGCGQGAPDNCCIVGSFQLELI